MRESGAVSTRGNNLDFVRQHNLSAVLSLVHHSGAVSRSSITRLTELNRSTVGALVAELVELGLVLEREPDATNQVGRPSPTIVPDPRIVAFAVNPELDVVTVSRVGLGGVVQARVRIPTDGVPSAEESVAIAAEAIKRDVAADADDRPIAIGVAVPGLVRAFDGLVRHAPHLGWVDEPIGEMMEAATGLDVFAANDASLGASAERLFGAGRGLSDLIYLNGGASGIGGGIISGGRPLGGVAGYAGEFGHIRVGDSSARDSAGLTGTLESVVTRSALLEALGLDTSDPDEFETALLSSTDPLVHAEIARQLDALGIALGAALNLLNPQLVVLGGFLGSLLAADSGRLDASIAAASLTAPAEATRIVRAALGADILAIGAAELAFGELLQNPAGRLAAAEL